MQKIASHFEEYIGRYVMLASVVLVPLSAGLGEFAVQLGGADTPAGRAVGAGAAAIGTAAAIGVWLKNLGLWQVATQPLVPSHDPPLGTGTPMPPPGHAGVNPVPPPGA
jgi:hypothetical protein